VNKGTYSAAVVVPLVNMENGINLLFTKRSASLREHAGEISFPGGKIETGEKPFDAAIREMHEEIDASVSIFFTDLEPVFTIVSSHNVIPFVCGINNSKFKLNEEVEKIYFLSMKDFLSCKPKTDILKYGRFKIQSYAWDFDKFYVWGVTGRILFSFRKKLTDLQFKNLVYNKMG